MILCVGEAVIDMIRNPAVGLGEVFIPIPGGCSYNTSIAISRLGVPAAFLGRLSTNFFGEMQIKRLRENKVRDDLIIRRDQNPIMALIKVEEGKDPEYAFYIEGTADQGLSIEELPPLPPDTSCIVFGSVSMTLEPLASTIESIIFKEAAKKKTVIAFDPNIRPFAIKEKAAYLKRFEKWAAASTIAKISSEDFEYISPGVQPEEALQKIIGMGTRLAIITLGPNGSIAWLKRDDGSVIKASSPGIPVPNLVDTVGAGDTFHGAFLAWLERNGKMSYSDVINLTENDLHDALTFANKAAAFVCSRHGAEPPYLKEVTSTSL
jgi:fructokinase